MKCFIVHLELNFLTLMAILFKPNYFFPGKLRFLNPIGLITKMTLRRKPPIAKQQAFIVNLPGAGAPISVQSGLVNQYSKFQNFLSLRSHSYNSQPCTRPVFGSK